MSDFGTGVHTDPAAARMLAAAVDLLRMELLPQLPDDAARIRADQLTHMLRWCAARLSKREAVARQFVVTLAGNPPVPLPPQLGLVPAEQGRDLAEAAFTTALPSLLDRIAASDASALDALEAMLRAEKAFYLELDPSVAEGIAVAYRGGRILEEAPKPPPRHTPLDAAHLTAYLRRYFGRDDVEAAELRAIPGGFSKLTLFFTLHDARAPAPRQLVIRQDTPFDFIDHSVRSEFPLLQRVFAAGLPVAEPLWLEADAAHFGAPFIVFARVEGSSNAAEWSADPANALRACNELAAALGRLHAFAPSALGYPAAADQLSAGACLVRDIEAWTTRFLFAPESYPLLELLLLWLGRNIPAGLYQRQARVAHGDIGFHNLMVDGEGRITAMLDWEFSCLSDPSQDLRFVRMFVEPLLPWAEFLAIYRAHGGNEPCADTDFFFDLWQQARNAIGCSEARTLFDSATTGDVKFALTGHVFAPYLFIDQCERLLAHLRQAERPG